MGDIVVIDPLKLVLTDMVTGTENDKTFLCSPYMAKIRIRYDTLRLHSVWFVPRTRGMARRTLKEVLDYLSEIRAERIMRFSDVMNGKKFYLRALFDGDHYAYLMPPCSANHTFHDGWNGKIELRGGRDMYDSIWLVPRGTQWILRDTLEYQAATKMRKYLESIGAFELGASIERPADV